MNIPKVKFINGNEIPIVGFGTYKDTEPEKMTNAVKDAIKAGYRHLDCAFMYENEEAVGKALKESIEESNGSLKREDFFITSKCGHTFHSRSRVFECLEKILKFLQVDYLDLYLVHWPGGFKEDVPDFELPKDDKGNIVPSDVHYLETWGAMEELLAQGKVKNIGLSNFNIQQLQDVILHGKVKPVCNQVEVNPYFANEELVNFCQNNGVVITAYGPLGAPNRRSEEGKKGPLEDSVILDLAKKHNKTPAQIILKWLIKRNIVVIPHSLSSDHIKKNFQLFDFDLSQEDFEEIRKLDTGDRFYKYPQFDIDKFYPFKKEKNKN